MAILNALLVTQPGDRHVARPQSCCRGVHMCYGVCSNAFGSVAVRPSEVTTVTCTSAVSGGSDGGRVTYSSVSVQLPWTPAARPPNVTSGGSSSPELALLKPDPKTLTIVSAGPFWGLTAVIFAGAADTAFFAT